MKANIKRTSDINGIFSKVIKISAEKIKEPFALIFNLPFRKRTVSMQEKDGRFYNFFKKHFVAQETIDLNIPWPSNFFKKHFVAQETIDLNIPWPSNFFKKHSMAPPINFSCLFNAYLQQYFRVALIVIFKFHITKEVNIHNNIKRNNIQINSPKNL